MCVCVCVWVCILYSLVRRHPGQWVLTVQGGSKPFHGLCGVTSQVSCSHRDGPGHSRCLRKPMEAVGMDAVGPSSSEPKPDEGGPWHSRLVFCTQLRPPAWWCTISSRQDRLRSLYLWNQTLRLRLRLRASSPKTPIYCASPQNKEPPTMCKPTPLFNGDAETRVPRDGRWSSGSWSDATEPVRMDQNGSKARSV